MWLPPGNAAIERWLSRERNHCTVSLDPNVRPSLLGDPSDVRQRWQRFLRLADIVKASGDDVAALHPGESVVDVARRWAATGPALVVVTLGADGAIAVVGDA